MVPSNVEGEFYPLLTHRSYIERCARGLQGTTVGGGVSRRGRDDGGASAVIKSARKMDMAHAELVFGEDKDTVSE